jgi:predicted small metal-binding protein
MMKTMSCKQLGGACELEFRANTFEEMAELSKKHGMEMHQQNDAAHLAAMQDMGKLMQHPEDMEKWYASKREEFEALPENT